MLEMTRFASWANVESCGCISMRSSRFATSAATTSTPAPMTTTIHDGSAAAAPNANPMPITWKSAPPAWERPLPWSRSLPDSTSGIAADLTASATRVHPWMNNSPTISATVAPTFPSDVSLPSGNMTATATIETTTAVMMLDRLRIRRRSNRSMPTPMNGLTSVYGT